VKPYARADAESELQDAMTRGDLESARLAAAYLDRLGPPPTATILGAALWYAAHRIPVFPLQPGLKIPLPGSRGCLAASCDELEVRQMFARPANLGLATGHVVDVLDFDGPRAHAAWGRIFPSWEDAGLQVLGIVATPRPGGLHVYVAATGRGNRADILKDGSGVDFRGVHGYVVAPPSSTPIGHYRWLRQLDPLEL
jgi:hypothetical protein